MVALGLVLLVVCAGLGAGIVLSNTDAISAEAFGVTLANVSVGGLFLLGIVVGALGMLGLGLMTVGAARKRSKKRAIKREVRSARGEQETLADENARLQAELEHTRADAPEPAADPASASAGSSTGTGGRGRHAR